MKGRLGDTFPKSFSTLDMRVTKMSQSGHLSSLVQVCARDCVCVCSMCVHTVVVADSTDGVVGRNWGGCVFTIVPRKATHHRAASAPSSAPTC